MEDDQWTKQGVEFKVITKEMADDTKNFLWEHFFPDEPIARSLGFTRHPMIDYVMVDETIVHNCSIAAVDKDGQILALRLGAIRNRSDYVDWMADSVLHKVFGWRWVSRFCPEPLKNSWIYGKLIHKIQYNVWPMFNKLGCDKIYEDKAVCSARTHGIKGLGTEVVRRSEKLAAELGCTHTYAHVTGIYSQMVFTKLEHTILTSLEYADFKDENGELYLKDTREHTSVITNYKKLI